jgi:hypothetical protein
VDDTERGDHTERDAWDDLADAPAVTGGTAVEVVIDDGEASAPPNPAHVDPEADTLPPVP